MRIVDALLVATPPVMPGVGDVGGGSDVVLRGPVSVISGGSSAY